jgi:hypothetical protein
LKEGKNGRIKEIMKNKRWASKYDGKELKIRKGYRKGRNKLLSPIEFDR